MPRTLGEGRRAGLVLSCFTSVVWLLVMPGDFSEVGKDGRQLKNGGDAILTSWRFMIYLLLVAIVAFVAVRCFAIRRSTVIISSGGASLFWYVVRSASARTEGANLFVVSSLLLCPVFFGLPAVVSWLARLSVDRGPRFRRSRESGR